MIQINVKDDRTIVFMQFSIKNIVFEKNNRQKDCFLAGSTIVIDIAAKETNELNMLVVDDVTGHKEYVLDLEDDQLIYFSIMNVHTMFIDKKSIILYNTVQNRTVKNRTVGYGMENIFTHYAASDSLYTAMVNPVCEKYELTFMEFTVLMFLANNPQLDTASDIVNYRHLTKSHVSMSIRNLENRGLLKGEYHEPNRRTIHLMVQDSANAIISDGRAAQIKYGEVLFSDFSDSDYNQLVSFMNRIDKNISNYIKKIKNK